MPLAISSNAVNPIAAYLKREEVRNANVLIYFETGKAIGSCC